MIIRIFTRHYLSIPWQWRRAMLWGSWPAYPCRQIYWSQPEGQQTAQPLISMPWNNCTKLSDGLHQCTDSLQFQWRWVPNAPQADPPWLSQHKGTRTVLCDFPATRSSSVVLFTQRFYAKLGNPGNISPCVYRQGDWQTLTTAQACWPMNEAQVPTVCATLLATCALSSTNILNRGGH